MADITFIILTFNEELHIKRCIERIKPLAKDIFIVDSFSTDNTLKIAQDLGVEIFQNKWEFNHAKQFNWALDKLPIKTEWVFRIDADEYLSESLIQEIESKLPLLPNDISGISFNCQRIFMNKLIIRGIVKLILLRLFRYGKGRCEERFMDEHLYVSEGRIDTFENPFFDHNLNNIGWWTRKHDGYSIREAIEYLNLEFQLLPEFKNDKNKSYVSHALAVRKKKLRYMKMPLFWRAFYLFIYRYFFKLGFINGKEGFLWHFLQGWWYRTLVDAKIFEIKKHCGNDKVKILKYIRDNYNIDLTNAGADTIGQ
jgi:glycosyltransferase involved in cell wall biosynthesis